MPPEGTPNSDIFFDEDEIPEEELIELLVPYIRLGKDTGRVVVTSAFEELTNQEQVTVLLLAQHLKEENDTRLKPSKIGDLAHKPVENLYPYIRELEQEELIENMNGQYYIPTDNIEEAMELIQQRS